MKPIDLLLTKEQFEQYIKNQQLSQATQYGMTHEEWQRAVFEGKVVMPQTGSHNTQHDAK